MNEADDIDGLAGEYVLGSLTDTERADVTARIMGGDTRLATAVAAWELRLGLLTVHVPSAPPPARALERILVSIAQTSTRRRKDPSSVVILERRVRRWRFVSGALAASMVVVAIVTAALWMTADQSGRGGGGIAILTTPNTSPTADEPLYASAPLFLARVRDTGKAIEIRQLSGQRVPAGRTFVAWLTRFDGSIQAPLGTLSRTSVVTTLPMPSGIATSFQQFGIALSVEPTTSEVGGRPAGPVISVGRLEAD